MNQVEARPKVSVSRLSKRFGGKLVVDDVSFDVAAGEFVVILGPSGCGKTTTLRLLAGLETADAGRISVDARVVTAPADRVFVRPEQRDIGMVFQSYAIWPHMSVFENVAFPLRVRKVPAADMGSRIERVLSLVGLAGEAHRSATALSGGQMQRVALARSLVFDPTLLLFDEPLSNLDLKLREHLRIELKELQRKTGITSVYVTHDQSEAVELADRVIVMEGGRIAQIGPPEDLYQRPRTRFVAQFIAAANIVQGAVESLTGTGLATVQTSGGFAVQATFAEPVSIGQSVEVVIHPEDCSIASGDTDGDLPKLRVRQRQFQGTSTRYSVEWVGGGLDVVTLGTKPRFDIGDSVRVRIQPERAAILARQVP